MEQPKHLWETHEHTLRRAFVFQSFLTAIDFVNAVARVSEEQHHHPNISIDYCRVNLTVNTHDAGHVVTAKDHELAAAIDRLYKGND